MVALRKGYLDLMADCQEGSMKILAGVFTGSLIMFGIATAAAWKGLSWRYH